MTTSDRGGAFALAIELDNAAFCPAWGADHVSPGVVRVDRRALRAKIAAMLPEPIEA